MTSADRANVAEHPPAPRPRWWLRYSLRTLLIVMTIAGIWLGVIAKRVRDQRAAVARIEQLGGGVRYDWQFDDEGRPLPDGAPAGWPLLRRLIGPEYFQYVVVVVLDKTAVTDADLHVIGKLRNVRELSLNSTGVSDAGLRELRSWRDLRYLGLAESRVTDQGLKYLAECDRLQDLIIEGTEVGDEGMRHIAPLHELHTLGLSETRITSAGVRRLAHLRKLQFLHISHTAVDDAAVDSLKAYVSGDGTRILSFSGTQISGRGQRAIREALARNSEIWDSDVFDVEATDFTTVDRATHWKPLADRLHALDGEQRVKLVDLTGSTLSDEQVHLLHSLKHVELIDLRGANVSDEAMQKLRLALPHCEFDR